MRSKYLPAFFIALCFVFFKQVSFSQCFSYLKPQPQLLSMIKQNLAEADKQYKMMAGQLAPGRFPKNYNPATQKFETSNSGWWCSGFYSGTLFKLYSQTHDATLLTDAQPSLVSLAKEQYTTHTHDLGFMMYCSFGNAY